MQLKWANIATNRIMVAQVEKGKGSKWLAGKLWKNESTVSCWCKSNNQTPIQTLSEFARLLNVDIHDLFSSTIN